MNFNTANFKIPSNTNQISLLLLIVAIFAMLAIFIMFHSTVNYRKHHPETIKQNRNSDWQTTTHL